MTPEPRRTRPPDWTHHAACLDLWPDLDWIDPSPGQADQCRAVCAGCPVRLTCLTFALVHAEPWGIWGGLDPDERAALADLTGLSAPIALPAHGFRARYAKHGCRCPACRHAHAVYENRRRHASPA
ncbi:MAG TPA: WhiB family transcriptional regulator [Pseudonocardiaceae bacterium]|jgi:WhiB family redox-sensing transcriptional regulator|nr:WhiB family transcriptional regulator [Pseudonocardiaceae bacterium]